MNNNENKLLSGLTQLENLISRNDDILDSSLRNKLAVEGFSSSSETASHLESLKQEGRSLKIGVIGRVKAGKSSLINALLFNGREVLPKAATPMTAALTSIGYAKKFSAEVHFFNAEDIADIKQKSEDYEIEINRLIQSTKEEFKRRQETSTREVKPLPDERLRAKAQRDLGDQRGLSAASDLYKRVQASGINITSLASSQVLTADSAEALNKQLMDFVGSSGKYMPFTRELRLGMPLESLKGIEVIDTPGVNDPVKSREQRTYERLKECNAAFLVSPAGQFLSQQDFELADRLSAREGTQEIYLVASQADTQLHASLRKDAEGLLPDAIEKLKQTLATQATSALANCDNEVLRNISSQLTTRLIVTSGICETLLLNNGVSTDTTASHAMGLLKESYRDYFTRPEDLTANLKRLSGRSKLQLAVNAVSAIKEDVLQQQSQHFIDAQWKTLQKIKSDVHSALSDLRIQVERTEKTQLEQELLYLKQNSERGKTTVNNEFIDQAEKIRFSLQRQLEKAINDAINGVEEKSEDSEGSERRTERVKKGGFFSGAARLFGVGGYETESYSVATLKTFPVRQALEGLSRVMRRGIKDCAAEGLINWRQSLISGITRQLRGAIGDDSIDTSRVQSVCRNVINKMINFPELDIPNLPGCLAKSGTIEGSSVDAYLSDTQDYVRELETAGHHFIDEVRGSIDSMITRDIGSELLSELVEETHRFQEMIEQKELTLLKIERMQKELGGFNE